MRDAPADAAVLLFLLAAISAHLLLDVDLFGTIVLPFAVAIVVVRLVQRIVRWARSRRKPGGARPNP